jgi:hypothetical protein
MALGALRETLCAETAFRQKNFEKSLLECRFGDVS